MLYILDFDNDVILLNSYVVPVQHHWMNEDNEISLIFYYDLKHMYTQNECS